MARRHHGADTAADRPRGRRLRGPSRPPGPAGPSGDEAVSTVNGDLAASRNVALTADQIPDGVVAGVVPLTERERLKGMATGATANAADAHLLDRRTAPSKQAISTVTGLQDALDGKADSGDVDAAVAAETAWTPIDYRYDNPFRYPGTGAMPRKATTRPQHWHVPAAFSLPNTGTTAGGTTRLGARA